MGEITFWATEHHVTLSLQFDRYVKWLQSAVLFLGVWMESQALSRTATISFNGHFRWNKAVIVQVVHSHFVTKEMCPQLTISLYGSYCLLLT